MITTTLNRIRQHFPRQDRWEELLYGLGKTAADDEPLPFAKIVELNGLDDALWCCRAEPQHASQWRLYAVWCARQVQHLMTDQRSVAALDVAERHARGKASDEELAAARDAAQAAARDAAEAVQAAARHPAWTAVQAAARHPAWTAWTAARAAHTAARAAVGAVERAAWDAAWGTAWAAQTAEFLRVVTETEGRS